MPHREGQDLTKGRIAHPNPTPPQSKLPSLIPFHHGWVVGRGRGIEREGGKRSAV